MSSRHFPDCVRHFVSVFLFNLSDNLVRKLRLCEMKELAHRKEQSTI